MPRKRRLALIILAWICICTASAWAADYTILLTMDAATTGHHHPAYPADPDLLVELGTDCDFAWAYLRTDSPDGASAYLTASTYFSHALKDWTLAADQRLSLIYAPFEQLIPAGATIKSAKLGILAKNNWYLGARDSIMVTNLTNVEAPDWWTSKGVGENPNQAHASWDHPIQGSVGSSNPGLLEYRGYPETSQGIWPWSAPGFHIWDLGCSQLSRFRGDECDGTGYNDPDCGYASFQNGHDIEVDLRRLVQNIVNGADNNGLALAYLDDDTSPTVSYYHWDTNALGGNLGGVASDYKPFLVITYSDFPFEPYLPDGAESALVFTTDDGIRDANLMYAQAFLDAGLPPHFGLFISEGQVGRNENHLTWSELVELRSQGVEIGSHSRFHAGDPDSHRDGLTVYDPNDYGIISEYTPGMSPDALTVDATGWDSLLVDTDPIWMYDGFEQESGSSHLDDPYLAKGFACPAHDFDLPAVRALHYHGYRYFRCGGSDVRNTNAEEHAYLRRFHLPTAEGLYVPSDSFRVYCPTNGEPHNAMGLPLTLSLTELDESTVHTEAEIKEWARHRMEVLMSQDLAGGILSIYTHDMPVGGTGWYADGCLDPQWLTWILEEYVAMGNVWICRPRDLNDWIRETRDPIDTPEDWLVHDAWRWTAEEGALVSGGGVPEITGIVVEMPPDPDGEVPGAIHLGRNYPNPFNPRTTVSFDLPRDGQVQLCVLDLRGRQVRLLVGRDLPAGQYQVTWDGLDDRGRAMPSGTYLFQLSALDRVTSEKAVLVR